MLLPQALRDAGAVLAEIWLEPARNGPRRVPILGKNACRVSSGCLVPSTDIDRPAHPYGSEVRDVLA